MPVYQPGRPIEEVARELGLPPGDIIKLASNENPLGPSPKALQQMRAAMENAHLYPDGSGFYLRKAIAAKLAVACGVSLTKLGTLFRCRIFRLIRTMRGKST